MRTAPRRGTASTATTDLLPAGSGSGSDRRGCGSCYRIQHIFTEVEGEAPSSEALRESFKTDSGTWSTRYHPSVSDIDASW